MKCICVFVEIVIRKKFNDVGVCMLYKFSDR